MSPNVNKTEELFTGLYEIRASTMSVVSASFVLTVINMLMAYGVIWYDRYGIDMKRTLMNKLVTSICWASIINIPLLQLFETPRMFFGPQPKFFCFTNTFLRNAVKWQSLLLLDASIVARYISIFWLKNPSAVKEDFWTVFINLWVVLVSLITNFVFFSRPGRMPIYYYTCTNQDPSLFSHIPTGGGHIDLFSILLHIIIQVRIIVYKTNLISRCFKNNQVSPVVQPMVEANSNGSEKHALTDFITHLAMLLLSVLYFALYFKTNSLSLEELNSYPNYFYYYTFQFMGLSALCFFACIIQYFRHSQMRKTILEEFNNFLQF